MWAATAMALFALAWLSYILVRACCIVLGDSSDCTSRMLLVMIGSLLIGVIVLFFMLIKCQISTSPPTFCSN